MSPFPLSEIHYSQIPFVLYLSPIIPSYELLKATEHLITQTYGEYSDLNVILLKQLHMLFLFIIRNRISLNM